MISVRDSWNICTNPVMSLIFMALWNHFNPIKLGWVIRPLFICVNDIMCIAHTYWLPLFLHKIFCPVPRSKRVRLACPVSRPSHLTFGLWCSGCLMPQSSLTSSRSKLKPWTKSGSLKVRAVRKFKIKTADWRKILPFPSNLCNTELQPR